MRPRRLIITFFVGLVIWVGLMNALPKLNLQPQVNVSEPAPEFEWEGLDGKKHAFRELKGKPVVVHFWATWCEPCREELPKLLVAAAAHKDVTFLLVSGDQKRDEARTFIAQQEILAGVGTPANILNAFDPDETLTFSTFQTSVYPETIFIDARHNMRHKVPGPIDWSKADVRASLDTLK